MIDWLSSVPVCDWLADSCGSYLDCGHPCETSEVHLRDDKSKDHLVLADMGCRNTVIQCSLNVH